MLNKFNRSFVKIIALLIAFASVFSFVGCKKYSNPDERLNYVLEESLVNELNASLDKSIKEIDSAKNDPEAVKVTIKPTLSSACLALLASSPVDLSIINDASIVLDTKMSKGIFEIGFGLNYKSSALISALVHLDTLAKKLFVTVPELFANSLMLDLNELEADDIVNVNGSGTASSVFSSLDLEARAEMLKTLKSLVNRYVDIVLKGFNGVTEEKVDLDIDGVESSVTRLTVKLTQKQVVDIFRELATTAKNDTELKDLLYDILGSGYTKEEFVADYEDELEDFIETPDSELVKDDSDAFELSVDVNKEDEIVGLILVAYDGNDTVFSFNCSSVKTKDAFALDLSVNADGMTFSLAGKGETVKGISNAEYVLSVDNEEYLVFEISDFDEKANEKGNPNYKGEITFGKALTKGEAAALGMFSLGFDVKTDDKAAEIKLDVNMNNAPFVSLNVTAETSDSATVTVPTNTVTDPMTFVAGMDLNGFVQKIEGSELPEEIKSLVKALISELE